MTVSFSVIRVLTNSADQAVASVELTTTDKTSAIAKYHEILADSVVKANSGRLADGAFILVNNGGIQARQMFLADEAE